MAGQTITPYIQILRQAFDDRIARNERYSLRAYARDLGMSPSALSSIFNGRKGLSSDQATKIAKKIALTETQTRFFILSVKAKHERSSQMRATAVLGLKAFEQRRALDGVTFDPISNWYFYALLELTELPDCEHKAEWFAVRLGLDLALVKRAIAQLIHHGHLEFKNNRFRSLAPETSAMTSKAAESFKKFHREILEKAQTSLVQDTLEDREFLSATFAFARENIDAAKKELREFQEAFARKYYDQVSPKDSVYQISMQFFRLDRNGESQ
jgi:uncharacterized protein (TIGR02147 family)